MAYCVRRLCFFIFETQFENLHTNDCCAKIDRRASDIDDILDDDDLAVLVAVFVCIFCVQTQPLTASFSLFLIWLELYVSYNALNWSRLKGNTSFSCDSRWTQQECCCNRADNLTLQFPFCHHNEQIPYKTFLVLQLRGCLWEDELTLHFAFLHHYDQIAYKSILIPRLCGCMWVDSLINCTVLF